MIKKFTLLFLGLLIGLLADASVNPCISIITPLYRGEAFVEGFLQDITAQTIFADCKLIFVNAYSPENENAIIEKYSRQFDNIKVINLDESTTIFHALNLGIQKSQSPYVYFAAVENRLHTRTLEKLAKALDETERVDCVYGDYWVTRTPNETLIRSSFRQRVTLPQFQPHFLHSCLPGPQPLWRRSLHDRFGYFKDDFVSEGLKEFWNRICSRGACCKKIDFAGTLCYENPQATDLPEIAKKREKESKWVYLTYCGYWLNNFSDSSGESSEEKPFVIVIASYNNKEWYRFNLDSVFSQSYSNYRVIYVDDCSTDGTGEQVEEYVRERNLSDKIEIIRNEKRSLALSNLYKAIHLCAPEEIVVMLDGDDALAHHNVLKRLNREYANPDVWFTYGQFAYILGYDQLPACGIGSEVPKSVISTNSYRNPPEGIVSALRSFYAGLFHRIQKEDLLYGEDFFASAYDVATVLPMLEMAGTHSYFIPDILYLYNRLTPFNDEKDFQTKMDIEIRSRQKYHPIDSYLPEESQVKRVYITTGQWGDLFAQGNPIFDRDDGLAPLIALRTTLAQHNIELLQTYSLANLEDPYAIICFDVPTTPEELQHLLSYPKEKRFLFLWEPPSTFSENFSTEMHQHFERIYTWADDLVDNERYFKFYYPRLNPMVDDLVSFGEKKFATLISCNKSSSHPDELYSARRESIQFFEESAPQDFDLYGRGWDGDQYHTYKGTIERKLDVLKKYKFNYCYENIKAMNGYVTEKIFDSFHAGCVPIYYGAPNITSYIPKNCFIDRRDFSSDQELYAHLKGLTEGEYNGYINNIRDYLQTTAAHSYSSTAFVRSVEHLLTHERAPYYFCTGANADYFDALLNLIGGIHRYNFDELGEIAVFDLGLFPEQVDLLKHIEKVVVYPLEMTHPELLVSCDFNGGKSVPGWFAWKPVCVKQALDLYPDVLWMDAGTTIMRPLNDLFAYIREHGYFLHNGSDWSASRGATRYVVEKLNLEAVENKWLLDDDVKGLEAGLLGITRSVYNDLIMPMYDLTKHLRIFRDDGTAPGGFGYGRNDQTLFSILAHQNGYHIFNHFEKPDEEFYLSVGKEEIPFQIAGCPWDRTPKTHIYCSRQDVQLSQTTPHIRYRRSLAKR